MTDKQIIIDGADVSGCIYFKMNNKIPMCRACNSGVGSPYCEYYKDCYYKQLKRKEQECEALQMSENEAKEIIAELKAENDTLRQFLSKEPLALQALQSAYSSYKKSADVFYEMVKQYKQTLTEIKEIAEYEFKELMNAEDYHNMTEILQQILQEISECEVENEHS